MNQLRRTDHAGCASSLLVVIGAIALGVLTVGSGESRGLLGVVLFSALTGAGYFLAIWLAVGDAPVVSRIMLAVSPGLFFGIPALATWNWHGIAIYFFLVLVVPLGSLPTFIMKWLGYRLTQLADPRVGRERRLDERPIQFSLRHLFILTAAVAVCAAAAKLISQVLQQRAAGPAIVAGFLLAAISAAAAAWAALGSPHPTPRLLTVSAVSGAACSLMLAPFDFGFNDVMLFSTLAAANTFMTGGLLLLFRRMGYRLLRVRGE